MHEILINNLLQFISENNPDLLFQLEEGKLTEYLSDKMSLIDTILNEPNKDQPALPSCARAIIFKTSSAALNKNFFITCFIYFTFLFLTKTPHAAPSAERGRGDALAHLSNHN